MSLLILRLTFELRLLPVSPDSPWAPTEDRLTWPLDTFPLHARARKIGQQPSKSALDITSRRTPQSTWSQPYTQYETVCQHEPHRSCTHRKAHYCVDDSAPCMVLQTVIANGLKLKPCMRCATSNGWMHERPPCGITRQEDGEVTWCQES